MSPPKIAMQIGVTIPPKVLARADKVIIGVTIPPKVLARADKVIK